MKQKLFTLLLAVATSVGTMFAEKVQIGDLYYNLDATNKTAEVTYEVARYVKNNYSGLTTATIPSSVIKKEVEYSVTHIGDDAFYQCSGLTSVTIPNSVTSIGSSAFRGCSGLTSVTIPNSVTSIGDYAFFGCSGLTSVTIPNSVTSIGDYAFSYCTSLTSVIVENGNTVYDSRDNCNAIIETATNTLIEGCKNTIIPNSVTSIGERAFYGCSGLTSVTIPNSVTSIGEWAFGYCSGLTSVIVENGNTVYDSRDNCNAIIETATNTLITGCKNTIIPNSVTSIGIGAFAGCSGLTSVTIPNSVTSIGNYAFLFCSGLTSITNYATTPQTITSYVFEGDIDYSEVNKSACTLYVPEESVDAYKAAEGWKDFENIVGVDVPGEDPVETIPGDYSIYYVDKESQELSDEVVTLHVPVAPVITGFTFVGWQASGMLEDGITLQAVYQADVPLSAPAVYTNPANPAQKLIRNGNVYILTDDNTYTITGQKVK